MTFQPPVGGGGLLNLSQITTALQNIVTAINGLTQAKTGKIATSSASWTPGAITSGSQASVAVTCAGAVLGMNAQAAYSSTISGLVISASVTAANTITVILANLSGSTITPTAGIVTVWASSI